MRKGFTLIELMIVIAIVALLAALLTPVLASAVRTARQASVQTEIHALETALADFKTLTGTYPPDHFDWRLYNLDGTLNPSGTTLHTASAAYLRRIFPGMPNHAMAALIAELQADPTRQRVLDGPACLVFWLNGVAVPGAKKIGPFFEFAEGRLYDANPSANDGYEGYFDPLPGQKTPYLYTVSSQYVRQDAENAALPAADREALSKPVYKATAAKYYMPERFQLVSPGYDGVYGLSRIYDAKTGEFIEFTGTVKTVVDGGSSNDNITNFGSGPLAD